MENIRETIGKNLAELRKKKGLTQFELAEKFNYSDRAISKWENGDTLPDIDTLYILCEFYGVTLDYLTHTYDQEQFVKRNEKDTLINNSIICGLFSLIVWMLATIAFVWTMISPNSVRGYWEVFVYAVPTNAFLLLVLNRIYFRNRLLKFIVLSTFVWSLLASVYLGLLSFNIWPIFIVGIPMQLILILWYGIRVKPKTVE